MENGFFEIVLKTGGMLASSIGKRTILSIFRHVILNQPDHVIERLFNSLSSAQEYNNKKLKCDTIRADWYFENDNNIKFVEEMVKQIINDTQGRKSEYITKFCVNIRLSSNDDIDEHTAFSYIETIEALSWRQLCIIRLIVLCKNQGVDIRHVSGEDVEQMPQDMRTSFYSLSREYENLMDNHYIESASIPKSTENNDPFLPSPSYGWLPNYTYRLHSLMNLDDIPMPDIIKIFSPWNVRAR